MWAEASAGDVGGPGCSLRRSGQYVSGDLGVGGYGHGRSLRAQAGGREILPRSTTTLVCGSRPGGRR